MAEINYAGEYDLKELRILTSSGVVMDATNLVQSIEMFENLESPSLTGRITIIDIDNVVENANIIGQEYMSLKIATPTLEEEMIDFSQNVFAIYKIVSKSATSSTDAQIFTLAFCSPELLRSNRTRVSKSYTDTIDNIVENILRDSRYLNTRKKLFLETTSGIRKVIAPNIRPFTFINNLKNEALSSKYNSPHFFFFETTKGIHFKTLQGMYAAGTFGNYNTGDIESLDIGKEKKPNVEKEFQRVLEFQINSNQDMLLNVRGGMLGSKVTNYNIFHKNFNTKTFRYFNDLESFPRIDENPIYNNSSIDVENNTIGDFSDARIHLHPTSSSSFYDSQYDNENNFYTYTPNQISDAILHRQSKILELNYGVSVSMKITGNTTIAVGQLINLTIPVVGRVHDKENDQYMSGKYLITKLRHMFSQADKKHEIALTACKDSLPKEYPTATNSRAPIGEKSESVEISYT